MSATVMRPVTRGMLTAKLELMTTASSASSRNGKLRRGSGRRWRLKSMTVAPHATIDHM
ncbi:MAG: hypothetical protein LC785_05450 [Acidobacteria bacterium]|nr:hypothetical protein [Acidobacteriota bacterium]